VEFSYRDKHYLRNALKIYLRLLEKYDEDDGLLSEEEYSEAQDDIMLMSDLLYEIEQNIEQLKKNAPRGTKLYLPDQDKT